MIQDIEPRVFDNQFRIKKAQPADLFLAYQGDTVLVREDRDKLWYPSFADFADRWPHLCEGAQFLFTIDDLNYFLVEEKGLDAADGWTYVSTGRFRTEVKYWRSFAGVVGWQLNRWYENHRFCSRCGQLVQRAHKERMLFCESCGYQTYPTISPCVIVAVYDGDRLLLTKYRDRAYTQYALIAGFAEIGESLEQAVRREVLEEVGLRVRNLRFYKSQPWPFSDSILAGFFAELDGNDAITLDDDELSVGIWLDRRDIPKPELRISLTGEMIEAFRRGEIG